MLIVNILSGCFRERFWCGVWSKRMTCQCGCYGRCTFDCMWRLMAWISVAWASGGYPAFRDDGVAFAESNFPGDKLRAGWAALKRKMKFRACFLQKRGDWSWLKQALAFVGWKGERPLKRCCYKCLANHGSLPFTDPTSNALWRLHELTHKMYIQLAYLQNTYIS